jgi:hypothetical protein
MHHDHRDLLRCNLRTIRAYLLQEDFQQFRDYEQPYWAGRFLDEWCCQVMRSRIDPMNKIATSAPLFAPPSSLYHTCCCLHAQSIQRSRQ